MLIMKIEGMSCKHCVAAIEKALNELDGVEATVSLEKEEAYVTLTHAVKLEKLKQKVEEEDYVVVDMIEQ